jgi:5-methylthioadenosine/S-adenosylhomocysteine deaminase
MARRAESRALRVCGGVVLTLDAADSIFDPGEVWIEDGRITGVGPRDDTPPSPHETVINAPRGLILPGLVNAHCHSTDALVRGTAPTLPLEAWSQFAEAGRAARTQREIYLSAALTAIEALKTGTSTLLDHLRISPAPDPGGFGAAAQAYLDAGVRAVVAPVLSDLSAAEALPLELVPLPAGYLAALEQRPAPWQEQVVACEAFVEAWHDRVAVQIGPSAPHRCSDALLLACGELAARRRVRLHTHFLETIPQAVVARRRFRRGAARHLADLGLLSNTSLVHCVHADDFDTIAASGAAVVHCPPANQRLASGRMPWRALASRGVPIALGTDGVLCNDSLSMFSVMKVAGLIHTEEPRPQPREILRAATAGGAAVCGFSDIASLEPGKRADLIVLGPSLSHDPYNRAVYEEEWRPVETVIVGGRIVVRDGRVVTFDEEAILEEAREASAALIRRNAAKYRFAEVVSDAMRRLVVRAREVYASTRSGMSHSGSSN